MKKINKLDERESLYMRLLFQEQKLSAAEIKKRFPQYSRATIYRHINRPLTERTDRRSSNRGRPSKLTDQDIRQILRKIPVLRQKQGTFTIKRLRLEAGVNHVSIHTVRRVLKQNGYSYLHSRKKGLLKKKDCQLRMKFARKNLRDLPKDFWEKDIGMYVDGTSFVYKSNPHDQATAPRSMAWRKKKEGLDIHCTAKGEKSGKGGRSAAFMVGISYNSGVVLCEQYEGRLNGAKFSKMIRDKFPAALERCKNNSKLILQDNCPVQTSKAAKDAFKKIGAELFTIPARSPDVNVIENFFHILSSTLQEEALNKVITKETYEEFSERVKNAILNISPTYINHTIASLNKRMVQIIDRKGMRIKY